MIEKNHPRISTARQCRLLGLPRVSYYHRPRPKPPEQAKIRKQQRRLPKRRQKAKQYVESGPGKGCRRR